MLKMKVNGDYLIKPTCIIIFGTIFFSMMVVAVTGMVQIHQIEKSLSQMVKMTKIHNQKMDDLKKLYDRKLHQ